MDGGKAEDQESQKFYDLISSSHSGGQGQTTIEFIMRSLEQDVTHGTNGCLPSSSNTITANLNNGMTMSMVPTSTSMELHSSMILQSLGINSTEGEESSSSTGDRPHRCNVCLASYKTRTHLRRHMTIHLNNRPYPCSECGKGFNRKEHLNKHIEAVHSGTKYKCQYCGKEISRKDHLSRHIKNMHPAFSGTLKDGALDDAALLKIQLPCGQKQKANLSFLTPTFAQSAMGQTAINTTGSSSNGKSPLKASKLQQQNNQQSQIIIDQPYQQLILQGSIVAPNQLATLTLATSSGQQKVQKLQTQNNNNGLVGLTNLSLTLGGQIREAPFANCSEKKMNLLFPCTECAASYSNEKDLNAHIKSHKPQNFRCSECPRAYTRREKLTEHIRCFHQGQKFKCEYCGKELSRKDHVLRHVRSIHPEVLASRFTAQMQENACESGMNGQDGSSNLLQGTNGSNAAALNEMGVLLRSVCHICLKVFGTSYHLSRHIESCHNGDNRPYPCSSCSKQFKRKDHLTKHLKSHCPSIREGKQNGGSRSKSLPNISKIKMEGQPEDKKARVKRMKSENGSTEGSGNKNEDCKPSDRTKQDDTDFSFAMLNSFIAESVNVVVEEEDLSSILQQQSSGTISESDGIEANDTTTTEVSLTSHNQITTFPCGYCQKEFSSRDQLVDHIQEHSNEDITQQDQSGTGQPHQEISSLELSSF